MTPVFTRKSAQLPPEKVELRLERERANEREKGREREGEREP
jgi:hypothetical protein